MAYNSDGFAGILRPYYLEPITIDKPEEPEDDTPEEGAEEETGTNILSYGESNPEEGTDLLARTEEDDNLSSENVSRRLFTDSDILEEFNFANSDDLSVLLDTQIKYESNYDAGAYNDKAGATGLTQFIPKTWEWAKEMGWIDQDESPENAASALKAQKAYMSYLHKKPFVVTANSNTERWSRSLGSYVWGEGKVRDAIMRATKETGDPNDWIEYAPYEAVTYIRGIMRTASERKRTGFKSRYQWKKWGGLLYY